MEATLPRTLIVLAVLATSPGQLSALQASGEAALSGQVVDAGTGEAVAGAEVTLGGTLFAATTDAKGRFRIEPAPAGVGLIRVQRIGYQSRSDTVEIPLGVSVTITLTLSVDPVPLEAMVVTLQSLLLEGRGFYERKQQGYRGFFIDRATIEDRAPLYVTDLFRSVPGVEVVNGSRLIMSQSVNFRDGGRGCEPSLWLDGIRSGLREYDFIRPDHIEGMEVYRGGSAPGKFNDLCGTVVIWTRVPIRR